MHHGSAISLKLAPSDGEGVFTGYASTFGGQPDAYGDLVAPGAFTATLAEHKAAGTMPALLWGHDQSSPIGRWTDLRQDSHGLKGVGKLTMGVPRARDAFELMKDGALSLSIGFRTRQSERKGSNRVITDAALHEISVVAMPANTSARITAVKSPREIAATRDVRAFEEFLRDSGFSRSIAKAITARGFNIAVCGQPDDANLADFLRSQTSKLQQLSKG